MFQKKRNLDIYTILFLLGGIFLGLSLQKKLAGFVGLILVLYLVGKITIGKQS